MKEGVDNIKDIALTKTAFIKADINQTGERMERMYQDQNLPIYYLRREVAGLTKGMLRTSSLEQLSEYTESAITTVLKLIEERIRKLEV